MVKYVHKLYGVNVKANMTTQYFTGNLCNARLY